MCSLQNPITIVKGGPTRVTQNVPFNFEVNVAILNTVKGVRIVDNLPAGLLPTGNATWTSTTVAGAAGPSGSEHLLLMFDDWQNQLDVAQLYVLQDVGTAAACAASVWNRTRFVAAQASCMW
jgi:hypothetical protein